MFITEAWQGHEKIWKVFWIYHVLVSVSVGIALESYLNAFLWKAGLAVSVAFLIAALVWVVWCYVSLWRCAFNSRWSGWGYIVRAYVVLNVVWLGLQAADFLVPIYLS